MLYQSLALAVGLSLLALSVVPTAAADTMHCALPVGPGCLEDWIHFVTHPGRISDWVCVLLSGDHCIANA